MDNMRTNAKKWCKWFFFSSICAGILPSADAGEVGQRLQETVLQAPGTILSETKRDLGNGYVEIKRSEVNPPGHWEGVGHFGFVYFKEEMLCQCGSDEVKASPNGKFAVYVDEKNGRLTLFRAETRSRKLLSKRYIGYPRVADWELASQRIVLSIENNRNRQSTVSKRIVLLD